MQGHMLPFLKCYPLILPLVYITYDLYILIFIKNKCFKITIKLKVLVCNGVIII